MRERETVESRVNPIGEEIGARQTYLTAPLLSVLDDKAKSAISSVLPGDAVDDLIDGYWRTQLGLVGQLSGR